MKKTFLNYFSVLGFLFLGSEARAQVYTPYLTILKNDVRSFEPSTYEDSSSGSGLGIGGVVEKAIHEDFDLRFGVAYRIREFSLQEAGGGEKRDFTFSSADIPLGIILHFNRHFSMFAGGSALIVVSRKCQVEVGSCEVTGGHRILPKLQVGLSLGAGRMRLEPYFERGDVSVMDGAKRLQGLGVNIHLFRDGNRFGYLD